MNTFEAIQTRRSVKHFDPDHSMTRFVTGRMPQRPPVTFWLR